MVDLVMFDGFCSVLRDGQICKFEWWGVAELSTCCCCSIRIRIVRLLLVFWPFCAKEETPITLNLNLLLREIGGLSYQLIIDGLRRFCIPYLLSCKMEDTTQIVCNIIIYILNTVNCKTSIHIIPAHHAIACEQRHLQFANCFSLISTSF